MKLALFDLDGTLLPTDSDHAFNAFVLGLGWADPVDFRRRNDAFFDDYKAGRLDMQAYIDFATSTWRERPLSEVKAAMVDFVNQVIRPAVRPQALDLVDSHRRAGDLVAVVTATNELVTRPIAALFGIDELLATELERDDVGRATGRIAGTPAFREGKVSRVHQWLQRRDLRLQDFERSTFYSDSTNDLPLLEVVSHPVATNPSPELAQHAQQRGWPILQLFNT
jgi:HAD superfamily hydrolase (TIGR01490 family)